MSESPAVGTRDWRLSGQEKYLFGATLVRRKYAQGPVMGSSWEDDHCEFCRALFMRDNFPDVLHEGYATPNLVHWICDDCFKDFRHMFLWKVEEQPGSQAS